jgi:hypothetical protein
MRSVFVCSRLDWMKRNSGGAETVAMIPTSRITIIISVRVNPHRLVLRDGFSDLQELIPRLPCVRTDR